MYTLNAPESSRCPIFDRLKYTSTEGEGLGDWSCAITSGRQRVDTQGAVPRRNNSSFMLIILGIVNVEQY